MKKIAVGIFSVLICMSLIFSASAQGMQINASDYIDSYSASVQADGNGSVSVQFTVVGTSCMDQIGATKIYLYEKTGTTTSLVATYNYTAPQYSDAMMGYNAYWKIGSVSYAGVSGRQYYATVYFIAGVNGGSDTRSYVTSTTTA